MYQNQQIRSERIHGYDCIRGFSVISMVCFHLCYDLAYIKGLAMPWFVGTLFQSIWRASVSWVFLALAGVMCAYSCNNFKRAGKYALVALAVWLVTSFAMPSEAISFGIIFCMASSTFIGAVIEQFAGPVLKSAQTVTLALVTTLFMALFLLCLQVPYGSFGLGAFGGPAIAVPRAIYTSWLSWLGFMSEDFFSADYYPIIPYTLLYLAGLCVGHLIKQNGAPHWLKVMRCHPLEFIGQHALEIYVLHQPLLLLVMELIRF